MYDIIIIGAGPAGMTAGIYAKQAKKNVLILEKEVYGGQILKANKVKNYPGFKEISGYELANNLYNLCPLNRTVFNAIYKSLQIGSSARYTGKNS